MSTNRAVTLLRRPACRTPYSSIAANAPRSKGASPSFSEYAGRLRALSEKEGLAPFDRGAFAAMLEYGVRQAGRRNKVTARFVDIADLAREAHYAAAAAGESVVRAAHVRSALASKIERHNLIETRIREMI